MRVQTITIPKSQSEIPFKISRMKGRRSICELQEFILILVNGRKIYAAGPRFPWNSNRNEEFLIMVLELEEGAKSIHSHDGRVLVQLESGHFETYKLNHHHQSNAAGEALLEIAERLPIQCRSKGDRVAASEYHLALFSSQDGATLFTKGGMVRHELTSDPVSSVLLFNSTVAIATPESHEIKTFHHPLYKEKVFASKTECIDAMAALPNSFVSLQTKKTMNLFDKSLESAKGIPNSPPKAPTSVLDTLMNINSSNTSQEVIKKSLQIHSTVSSSPSTTIYSLDNYGQLDRLESDGSTKIFLYGPSNPYIVHFNSLSNSFSSIPLPEGFVVLDLVVAEQLFVFIGRKSAKKLFSVDTKGFTDFEEVRILVIDFNPSSNGKVSDLEEKKGTAMCDNNDQHVLPSDTEKKDHVTLRDILEAIQKLDKRMERIENIISLK